MTNKEFEELVLSRTSESGSFKPKVIYDLDDDSLEVLVSPETYRIEKPDGCSIFVYCGLDSGAVTGVLITKVSRIIKDMKNNQPDIHLEVHNGKFKVKYLFRAIREQTSKQRKMILGVLIKQLEEAAERYDLEANFGGCAAAC
jgi:hypothetical protein